VEVADKFRACTEFAGGWSKERVQVLISTVGKFETVRDVAEFVQGMLVVEGA
jgi:hypothetical protein